MRADTDAALAFRRTAAALSTTPPDTRQHRTVASNAAIALVHLALAGDQAELASLLNPDPGADGVIWTVACYQIGGLIPAALHDFTDPVEAVAVLIGCPSEEHVAAELVASTPGGLRWTALARTNDLVVFHLPDAVTASDASHEHPSDLAAALGRWRQRLASWRCGRAEPWGLEDDLAGSDGAEMPAWQRFPEEPEALHAAAPTSPPPELGAVEALAEVVRGVVAEQVGELRGSVVGELAEVSEMVRAVVAEQVGVLRRAVRDDLAELGRALRADMAGTEARLTSHLDRVLAQVQLQATLSGHGAPGAATEPRRTHDRSVPVDPIRAELASPAAPIDLDVVAGSIRAELAFAEANLAAGLSTHRGWE